MTSEWPDLEHPNAAPFLVDQVTELKRQGVDVTIFHFRGGAKILNYLLAWWNLRQVPAWKQAQILHAHWGQSAFLALFSTKKLVITYHGSDLQGIVNAKGRYTLVGKSLVGFSRWVARRADHCILVSDRLKNFLPKSVNKLSIIPVGIDLQKFRVMEKLTCRQRLSLVLHKQYVIFLGDPKRPEKQFLLAKKAVEEFNCLHPIQRVDLLVVNGIDHDLVPYYLNAADALILSSSHEGSPVVVKEALACHLPVVSFDVGDVKERIGHLPWCYLCKEKNSDCLVLGLEYIFLSPTKSYIQPDLDSIDEKNNVEKIIKIYRQLVLG